MKSEKKRLLIMLALVIAMAALLILINLDLSSCSDDDSDHDHTHDEYISDSDQTTLLIDRMSNDLDSIELTNKNGTFHIRRSNGGEGELEIAELTGLPVETDFIELAWFDVLSVSSIARIAPDDDLASLNGFGLAQPQVTVKCDYKDGTCEVIRIGDMLADQEGRYYFRVNDDPNVYVSDFNLALFQGDPYWLKDDFFGDANESVDITDIFASGPQLAAPIGIRLNNASQSWQKWYGYRYIISENGNEYPADDYICKLFVEELEKMMAENAVCAHPTEQQIASYGLDRPKVIIKHKRNGVEQVIRISRYDHAKSYAMADGIDVIYELKNDSFPLATELTSDSLRSPDVNMLYFDAVSKFTVRSDAGVHSFSLTRKAMNGDGDLYEYFIESSAGKATLNEYKSLLEVFNSAQATEHIYDIDISELTPALRVTVEFFDERRPTEEICCYPIGTRRYLYTINGKGDAVVTQLWLDKLIGDAQSADNGISVVL